MKIYMLIILQFLCYQLRAEDKLEFKQIFTEIPATTKLTFKESFSKEALPYSKNINDESNSSWNVYPTLNGLIATRSF